MYTLHNLKNRVKELTKVQCKYLIENLKMIPYDATTWVAGVPYVQIDPGDFPIYPYEVEMYDGRVARCEAVDDYIIRQWENTLQYRTDPSYGWSNYLMQETFVRGYRLPWNISPTDYRSWRPDNTYSYEIYQYINEDHCVGMEPLTSVLSEFIDACIMPLSVFHPSALSLYGCGEVKSTAAPRGGYQGAGIREIECIWNEIGGSVDYNSSPQCFPFGMTLRQWKMPDELAKNYIEACWHVVERVRNEWPKDYEKWVKHFIKNTDKLVEEYHER